MKTTIQCVNCDISAGVKRIIEERLEKYSLKYSWIKEAVVMVRHNKDDLDREKEVSIRLSVPGQDIFASANAREYHEAANKALEGIRRGLRKRKEKEFGHPRTPIPPAE